MNTKISAFLLITGILALLACSDSAPNKVDDGEVSSSSSMDAISSSSSAPSSSIAPLASSSIPYPMTSSSSIPTAPCTTVYGTNTFLDCRDSITYKTVEIGSQTWMAENLNFKPATGNSWCYDNLDSNCLVWGRLYDREAALTACPRGWILPDTTEWNKLEGYLVGLNIPIYLLSSSLRTQEGWSHESVGTDLVGFSAFPGGYLSGIFVQGGEYAHWWTASDWVAPIGGQSYAVSRFITYYGSPLIESTGGETGGLSVRCIKG